MFPSLSYEPELFPGLIYRMVKPRIVLLIFVSGKVVLTGQFRMKRLMKLNLKQTYRAPIFRCETNHKCWFRLG